MNYTYIIKMPKRVVGMVASSTFSYYVQNSSLNQNHILIDFSELVFIDIEGCSSIISFIRYFKTLYGDSIKIRLPENSTVNSFLFNTNVLQNMFIEGIVDEYHDIDHFLFCHKNIVIDNHTYKKANTMMINKSVYQDFLENELIKLELVLKTYRFDCDYFCEFFYETANNVFEHSEREYGSLAYHRKDDYFEFILSDVGIGIRNSLIKNEEINKYLDSRDYLLLAIEDGVSETSEDGRGLGLGQIINTESQITIASSGSILKTENGKVISLTESSKYFLGTVIKLKLRI